MPTGRRHYRLKLSDAIGAHDRALQSGGRDGVVDLGLVEAAIGRPYIGYNRRIYSKAAALIQSVATNHGFIDGNKRTAIILTILLIERSGYVLQPLNDAEDLDLAIEELVLSIVGNALAVDEISDWFKARLSRAR